jgi:diguanylate cyclase (GGDEF)-like protein
MTPHLEPQVAIIAEDEDLGRLLLAQCAEAVGLKPMVFDNGTAALHAALTHQAAVVLLDVEMPGLDGYTVCRRIRAERRLDTVPVVMVTGHDDKNAINLAFEAGATDFISKPVSWALLPHRLEYILRNAASARTLADREAKVRTLLEAIPDALWVVSPVGESLWSPNDPLSTTTLAAHPPSKPGFAVSLPPDRLVDALRVIRYTAQDGISRNLKYRVDRTGESQQSFELRFSRCEGGDVLVVRQDTTERTAAAEHIEQLAFFDTLTGLPNRPQFTELSKRCIASAAETGQEVALIYLDLNSFKRINDTFGHSTGDVVLQKVAGTLTRQLAEHATQVTHAALARLGGDEFVFVVQDSKAREWALRIAAACCSALDLPIVINNLEFLAPPSIGISVYPDDGADVESLLKHADIAMYQAKLGGAPKVAAYNAAMSARLRDWLDLESRLRRAVRNDMLELRFQPKIRLSDNRVVGVEALSRWYDPDLGEVPPIRFIQVAEESGLIVDLGAWLIRAACKQARDWLGAGFEIPIAINISGKELLFGDPARSLETEIARFGISPSLIEVEITESVFVSDSSVGRSSIEKIKRLGCRIALDDFGTGYSSLSYLSRFPPDRLKIDRSFIHNVDQSESDAGIVNAIMSLAQTLGLQVTAEGIERNGQLEWLRARGCQEAQGYLLGPPMLAREIEHRISGSAMQEQSRWSGTMERPSVAV